MNLSPAYQSLSLTLCVCFVLGTPVWSATPIKEDPKGFFGSLWGNPLKNRSDLKEVDSTATLHIYTSKSGPPRIGDITMESVKLYSLEEKYARALFHYHGEAIHQSLLNYLEIRFGKIENPIGSRAERLSQYYIWRGNETEITLTYNGFRERGVLTVESRVYAPLFLDALSDHSY